MATPTKPRKANPSDVRGLFLKKFKAELELIENIKGKLSPYHEGQKDLLNELIAWGETQSSRVAKRPRGLKGRKKK